MITLLAAALIATILAGPVEGQRTHAARGPAMLCSLNHSFGADSSLIVDLSLKSDGRYPPSENVLRAVTAAGGRVLHAFHVSVLRVQLHTSTLRRFLGPDSIAEVAYPVRDTTRLDVGVQVFLGRDPTPADDSVLRSFGVRGPAPPRRSEIIAAAVADAAIPKIAALASVAKVRAANVLCMTVDIRDLILPRARKP